MTYAGPLSSAEKFVNIHLSRNDHCDPSGFGEGGGSLGSNFTTRKLDTNGDFFTTFSIDADINPGDLVTAMLSSGDVPSTEFSNCYTVPVGPNATPVAGAQGPTSVLAGQPFDIQLSGTDADDDNLTFEIATSPQHGVLSAITGVTCAATNSCTADVTYTPSSGYSGSDSFTFTVNDGQVTSAPATVTLDVQAVNGVPLALDTSEVAQENDSVVVHLEGLDPDGDALTFEAQTVSVQGGNISAVSNIVCEVEGTLCTAEVTYTAPADYVGPDSFTFTVEDGQDTSAPATVMIDVQAVANVPPEAFTTSASTTKDTAVVIQVAGFDAEGALLDFFADDLSVEDGQIGDFENRSCLEGLCTAEFTYTPPAGFTGSDSFTFVTVDDAEATSDPAIVTVDVQATNTLPVAFDTSAVAQENDSVVVQLEGADVDDDPLAFSAQTESEQGGSVSAVSNTICPDESLICTAEVTYTAPANYSGPDSFTFTVDDGQESSDPATVTVEVQPANVPPEAFATSASTTKDTAVVVQVAGFDAEGALLDFFADGTSVEGGVIGAAQNRSCLPEEPCTAEFTYTPPLGFTGSDSFTFVTVDETEAESDPATVTIDVQATNTRPVASEASAVVQENGSVVVQLEGEDADGDALTFSAQAESSQGGEVSAVSTPVCEVEGTLCTAEVYVGSDSFTFTVNDGQESSDPATVTIDVQPEDAITEDVPPSNETVTVATAETVLVGGEEIPIAQPGDTTAAAAAVPPGGPGGEVTVAEFDCEIPFCLEAARTVVPTPGPPPIDERVVQFIPPFAPFYDYRRPVTYTIVYDASVVAGVNVRTVTALYTKEDDPGTGPDESLVLYRAAKCPKRLTAGTEFPCLKSVKVLKSKNQLLKGDLVLTLLGTYDDPKIAGFR
jgi:hypothetical protein